MIRLPWPVKTDGEPLHVLCLGAHSDDIEIGCGGTMLSLLRQNPEASVTWVVLSGDERRRAEAEEGARQFLGPSGKVVHGRFRDGYFPFDGAELKDFFEAELKKLDPDVIFTHYRADRHQDHRLVSDLTWNTFRSHLILEYEIIKYDGDLGTPGLFVGLTEEICRAKIDSIMNTFASQTDREWFDRHTFWSMLRLRGVESGAPSGLAEAFHARKLLI